VNRRNSVAETTPNESAPGRPESLAAPCRHLRTNGMYVFDNVPEDDEYESSGAWCQRTMKSFGPDDDFVGRRECRDSGRSCYEPL
jgi:hypothetical protein